tara:strand:- start:89 stop:775 length:687 start_codon:yes stop_codon:yes gene_type:complete
MDPEPLLEKSAPPVAHVSGRLQLVTLLVRKELLLKLRRPLVTVFEILFPVALCAILIAGSAAATTNHYNSSSFAPEDFDEVLGSLGPQVQLPLLAEGGALSTSAYAGGLPSIPVPGAVPPLGLFLLYANVVSLCAPKLAVAPADGTAFAVAPDNSETRRLARLLVADTDLRKELETLEAIDPTAKNRTFDAIVQFCGANLPYAFLSNPIPSPSPGPNAIPIPYPYPQP